MTAPEWYGVDAIASYLYIPAIFYAIWQLTLRQRMDRLSAMREQMDSVPQCISNPMTRFTLLLLVSYILRWIWFFVRATNVLEAPETEDGKCRSGWRCRNSILESAINRSAQLVFFAGFSLIPTYWRKWALVASGGPDQDIPPRDCFDLSFLLLSVWQLIVQVLLLIVLLAFDLETDAQRIYQGYLIQVGILYIILACGILYAGHAVQSSLKRELVEYQRWKEREIAGMGGVGSRKQRAGKGLHSVMQLATVLNVGGNSSSAAPPASLSSSSTAAGPRAVGRGFQRLYSYGRRSFGSRSAGQDPLLPPTRRSSLNMSRTDSINSARSDSGDSVVAAFASMPMTERETFRVPGAERGHMDSDHEDNDGTEEKDALEDEWAKETADSTEQLLRTAWWRVQVIQWAVAVLFVIRAVLFSLNPIGNVTIPGTFGTAVHPWFFYPVPELFSGVLVLVLTHPHGGSGDSGGCGWCGSNRQPCRAEGDVELGLAGRPNQWGDRLLEAGDMDVNDADSWTLGRGMGADETNRFVNAAADATVSPRMTGTSREAEGDPAATAEGWLRAEHRGNGAEGAAWM